MQGSIRIVEEIKPEISKAFSSAVGRFTARSHRQVTSNKQDTGYWLMGKVSNAAVIENESASQVPPRFSVSEGHDHVCMYRCTLEAEWDGTSTFRS